MKKIIWVALLTFLLSFVFVYANYDIKPATVLHPVKVKGKWGYIDSKGKVKVSPQFEEACEFSEGMAAIKLNNRWGFINQTGKIAIKPQFELADDFHEGLAYVVNEYGREKYPTAFIDKKGVTILDTKNASALFGFNSGHACLIENHKFYSTLYFIDRKGNVLDKKTIDISTFPYEALLRKLKYNIEFDVTKGKNVIDPTVKEGLARVWIPSWDFSKWGYIDQTGKMAIEPSFSYAGNFSEGMAVVKLKGLYVPAIGNFDTNKLGYIDPTGKVAIEPQFDYAEDFKNGAAEVCIVENNNYNKFKIDKTGKELSAILENTTNASIDEPTNQSPLIAFFTPFGHGFIDASGKTVILAQYAAAGLFHEGLAAVKTGLSNGKWGFADKNKKIVIPAQYDDISNFSEGLAAVRIGTKWGFINKSGKIVIKPQFDTASDFSDGIAKVTIGDMLGYVNKNGLYVWKLSK